MPSHRSVAVIALLALALGGCVEVVRVPLAVPLPPVGGARPATPQGLELVGEFGDGVWGQEQERAEMAGGGLGFAIADRIEVVGGAYVPTRSVFDTAGGAHTGEGTTSVRGKLRFGDFLNDRASIGVHVARMSASRDRPGAQDESLTALDLAVPIEFYPAGPAEFVDWRWGLYVAPRLVAQTFQDRIAGDRERGTMYGVLLGGSGRWRYIALTGELNFARAPSMTVGGQTFSGGWHLLPMGGVRAILPIG